MCHYLEGLTTWYWCFSLLRLTVYSCVNLSAEALCRQVTTIRESCQLRSKSRKIAPPPIPMGLSIPGGLKHLFTYGLEQQ